MTEPIAPQEDQLILPPEWLARVLPRRGNGVRRPAGLDGEAPLRVREQVEANLPYLHRSLESPDFDAALAAAGLAHLEGEPSPEGAAVVSLLLRATERYGWQTSVYRGLKIKANREPFESWAVEFGLPFAVSAAVEELSYDIGRSGSGDGKACRVRPGDGTRFVWHLWGDPEGPIAAARGLIAEAEAEEYRRTVAEAAERRTTRLRRTATAYLLPDEADWAARACEEMSGDNGVFDLGLLWLVVGDTAQLAPLRRKAVHPAHLKGQTVAELVCNLGAAALPILTDTLNYKSLEAPQRAALFEGIAMLPCDEAMAFLIDRSGEPQAPPAVRSAAARFPVRAAKTLASRATALSGLELARLGGLLRSADPERFAAALAHLGEGERAAVTGLAPDAPVAGHERLPQVLTSPPWANRRAKAPRRPALALESPQEIEIVWEPAEYERARAIEPDYREWDEDGYWSGISGQVYNQVGLALADAFWGQLARNGAHAADAIVERLRTKPRYGKALVPIRSAKAAALAVDWLARRMSARAHAVAWLDRHGEHAVPLLAPMALGSDRRRRGGAEVALRHVADRIGAEAAAKAAGHHGPEAAERIASLLAGDAMEPPFGVDPAPGAWADPDMLPPVLLRDRDAALPRSAVSHLIAILSLWSPLAPYRGADAVAETCDPESLTRFCHALFELWLSAGAPSSDAWAVGQLARFGTDATVALLEPMVRSWPGSNHADRAVLGLEALAAIGTEAAFGALYRMSRLDKFPATTLTARELAERVATRRGFDTERFADRIIPDHGLADPAALTLDYGPRHFSVRFDDLLRPRLADDSGKPRPRLPKPGVRDDEATARASIERYKRLTKDVERTAAEQAQRLREAMLSGRTWSAGEFRALAEHPIVSSLAGRLVWATGEGTGFRLAEDGGLADVHDREIELGPDAAVRLAHPALLGDELPAWIQLFSDYTVLQPFPQLARPAMAFAADEAATGHLRRFEGATATMGALQETMRWSGRYASPEDFRTRVWGFTRRVTGGWLLADIDPAPGAREPDPRGRHRLVSVRLMATQNRRAEFARPLPGERLGPVEASELLADLTGAIEH
ncbi:DUF4132 domain-containing protein [Glycomyces arizonensis]|uniref:DUF4132 domain-containing protein n=1 Tax=Glycomyces arizonensis TaxID=256035 RepID=UPI000401E5D6|nr:DUF4132 domain-containing protein [Glycomyces arizonensis]